MLTWRRSSASLVLKRYNSTSSLVATGRLRCADLLNTAAAPARLGTERRHGDDDDDDGGSRPRTYENQEITLKGFVRSVRKQKRFAFAEISDGSTVKSLQAILTPEQASE